MDKSSSGPASKAGSKGKAPAGKEGSKQEGAPGSKGPQGGGGLVPVALVVGAAVAFAGLKLLKGLGKRDKGDQEEKSAAAENGLDHATEADNISQNSAASGASTDGEIAPVTNGTAVEESEGAPTLTVGKSNETESVSKNSTPASSPYKLKLAVPHSPFNTAPNSPLHPPDSPFHDAAGELDFEDGELTPTGKHSSFSDWMPEKHDQGRPNGLPSTAEESDESTVTSESKEPDSSKGPAEEERASVQALLARARAAAARVDKMHASINEMVNSRS